MAIENLAQYLAAGNAQTTALTGRALQNAEASLLAVSPFLPNFVPRPGQAPYVRTLPYFVVQPDNSPRLVIPPPQPAPLPTAQNGIQPDPHPPETPVVRASRAVPPGGIGTATDSTGGLQPAPGFFAPGSGLRPASLPPAHLPAPAPAAPGAPSPVPGAPGSITTSTDEGATQRVAPTPAPGSGSGSGSGSDCTSAIPGSGLITTPEQRTTEEQVQSALTALAPTIAQTGSSPCTQNIQINCTMPVTPADILTVDYVSGFWNSVLTSFTLPVQAKVLLCDGTIQTIATGANIPVVGPNDVTDGQITVQMPVGCLLNVSVGPGPYCCHPGEIWVHGYLTAGGAGGNIAADLLSGYVTDGSCVTWPGSGIQPWGQGRGNDNWFDVGTISPPAFLGFSPAQGTIMQLRQVSFIYVSDATAGNRSISLGFSPLGTNSAVYFGTTQTQAQSLTYRWTFASGILQGSTGLDRNGHQIVQVPIPDNLYTDFEGGMRIWVNGAGSSDQMQGASVYYQSWMEPRSAPF
jgi:hypothetical protein